jgi:hypothetical protein
MVSPTSAHLTCTVVQTPLLNLYKVEWPKDKQIHMITSNLQVPHTFMMLISPVSVKDSTLSMIPGNGSSESLSPTNNTKPTVDSPDSPLSQSKKPRYENNTITLSSALDLSPLLVPAVTGALHSGLPSSEVYPEFKSEKFDVLIVENPSDLRLVALQIFMDTLDIKGFGISPAALIEYIRQVSIHYKPNPFHNFYHAVNVLHCMYTMVKRIRVAEIVDSVTVFSFLLSALTHDVGHTGRTNSFEINSASKLALRYNDNSVLENHHCSLAFRLLQKNGANVLFGFSADQKKNIRKTMIACILATDMSKHTEILDEAKSRFSVLSQHQSLDAAEATFLGKLLLHAADLSGPAKEFKVAREWSSRVTEEFNAQVAIEVSLRLPVLGFMAAPDELTFLKNEIGFSTFFVAPLCKIVSNMFSEMEFASRQLEENISKYTAVRDAIERERGIHSNEESDDHKPSKV